jgi:hypothetical protein
MNLKKEFHSIREWFKKHIKKSSRNSESETLITYFKKNMPSKFLSLKSYYKRDWFFFIGNLIIYNQELKQSKNLKKNNNESK